MLFLLPLEYFGKLFFGGRFVLYEISLRLKSGEHFVLRIIFITRKIFFYGVLTILPAFLLHPLQPDFDVLLKPVVLSNLLFLAVLASLVCYVLWNVVLKQLGTVRASNYIYLNPLVTMVASVIILHEKITWITLLGAGCIIFGVYQAEKK